MWRHWVSTTSGTGDFGRCHRLLASRPVAPPPPHPSLCSEVVRNHLLGLRWMNPNAVVYLREERGQGTPVVEYELCECPPLACGLARLAGWRRWAVGGRLPPLGQAGVRAGVQAGAARGRSGETRP